MAEEGSSGIFGSWTPTRGALAGLWNCGDCRGVCVPRRHQQGDSRVEKRPGSRALMFPPGATGLATKLSDPQRFPCGNLTVSTQPVLGSWGPKVPPTQLTCSPGGGSAMPVAWASLPAPRTAALSPRVEVLSGQHSWGHWPDTCTCSWPPPMGPLENPASASPPQRVTGLWLCLYPGKRGSHTSTP